MVFVLTFLIESHFYTVLYLSPSIMSLQESLKVLNVSGNNLDSLKDLECMRQLTHFICVDNQLNDMKELANVLGQWYFLKRLDLLGNPLCHKAKYRDRIIVMAKQLGKLLYQQYFSIY